MSIDNVVITSTGVIATPKECDTVSIPIVTVTTGTVTHKEWILDGVIPVGLEFLYDNNNPRIVGKCKMFVDQSVIPMSQFYPKEDLKMDGSNRMNNGDLIASSYTFDFSITHKYSVTDILTSLVEEKEVSSSMSIVLNHLDNKQNTMFMKSYLKSDELEEFNLLTMSNGVVQVQAVVKPREVPYDGRVYRKNDIDDLLRNHPGPFSICEGN